MKTMGSCLSAVPLARNKRFLHSACQGVKDQDPVTRKEYFNRGKDVARSKFVTIVHGSWRHLVYGILRG